MKKLQFAELSRLEQLAEICNRAAQHLEATTASLFATPMTLASLEKLATDSIKSEQLDAFTSRFARLQDNLGAKLLPFYLNAVDERGTSLLENLDKAERLNIISSADEWLLLRQLRNQMVHEYIQDLELLLSALTSGQAFVKELLATNNKLQERVKNYLARYQ